MGRPHGTLIRTFRFEDSGAKELPEIDISADGSRMAFTTDKGVSVLDLTTGKVIRRLTGKDLLPKDDLPTVRLSADGKLLATWAMVGEKGNAPRPVITVRDVTSGKVVQRLRGEGESGVYAVLFAPDGKTATAAEFPTENNTGKLVTYDLATGKAVRRVEPAEALSGADPVQLLDGKRLLAFSADAKAVLLLDADTGKVLRRFAGGQADLFGLSASANGKRFISSDDNTVTLWETETGNLVRRIEIAKGNKDDPNPPFAALSPDGRGIAVGVGRSVRIGTRPQARRAAASRDTTGRCSRSPSPPTAAACCRALPITPSGCGRPRPGNNSTPSTPRKRSATRR